MIMKKLLKRSSLSVIMLPSIPGNKNSTLQWGVGGGTTIMADNDRAIAQLKGALSPIFSITSKAKRHITEKR